MYTADKQDKFIELRAQGWTLGHIATELFVSRRTLVEWNRLFAGDIQAFRAAEKELLQEKYLASREEELERLARLQKDVDDELANRPLHSLPIDKLFHLAMELRREIQALREDPAEDLENLRLEHSPLSGKCHCRKTRPVNGRRAQPLRQPEAEAESASDEDTLPPVEPANRLAPATVPVASPPVPSEPDGGANALANGASTQPSAASPKAAKAPEPKSHPDGKPIEHCLACGAELPALLPNGQRPSHYCDCGQSLTLPGLSLREHCAQCGVPLPVHGYNSQRLSDTCPGCGASLPALDPKANPPWIPPGLRPANR
jgi:hypothetical protein